MSKNLEKEYREFTAESTPDLWDRIEEGLEPRRPQAAGKSRKGRYLAWGMAACLCLTVAGVGWRALLFPGCGPMSGGGGEMWAAENRAPNDFLALTDGGTHYREADNAGGGTHYREADNAGGMAGMETNDVCEAPREAPEAFRPQSSKVGEGASRIDTIQIRVLEVLQEAEETTGYIVEVVESEELSLQEGERITLRDGRDAGEALEAGTVCRLRLTIVTEPDGTEIYSISGVE